jgi:hypothetical protein
MARFTIHPPYFIDRFRSADPKNLRDTSNTLFAELHRFLRYLMDANDQVQQEIEDITGDEGGLNAKEAHAKMMIRESLGF